MCTYLLERGIVIFCCICLYFMHKCMKRQLFPSDVCIYSCKHEFTVSTNNFSISMEIQWNYCLYKAYISVFLCLFHDYASKSIIYQESMKSNNYWVYSCILQHFCVYLYWLLHKCSYSNIFLFGPILMRQPKRNRKMSHQ